MSTSTPKSSVAANFSAAAGSYEGWAEVQKRSALDLIQSLPPELSPTRILDIGCGTGLLTRMLVKHFETAKLTGLDLAPAMTEACRAQWPAETGHNFICADAEAYCSDRLFDLIASNFAFQWFENKTETVANLCRQLSAGGVFALSVPVEGTLIELETAFQSALHRSLDGLNYPTPETYISGVQKAGLQVQTSRVTPHTIQYPSAMLALKSFKEIGAVFAGRSGRRPMSPAELKRVTRAYEDHFSNSKGSVPVTYQVLTLIATI